VIKQQDGTSFPYKMYSEVEVRDMGSSSYPVLNYCSNLGNLGLFGRSDHSKDFGKFCSRVINIVKL